MRKFSVIVLVLSLAAPAWAQQPNRPQRQERHEGYRDRDRDRPDYLLRRFLGGDREHHRYHDRDRDGYRDRDRD